MSAPVELLRDSVAYVIARFEAGRLREQYRALRCGNAEEDVAPCYLGPPDCTDEKCDDCKEREAVFLQFVEATDKAAKQWKRIQRHLARRYDTAEAQK